MRPKRRRIKFDEESVNNLLQEIYDESFNQRAKITRLFVKWENKVKEGGEIAAIGDQIVKLIAAEAKNQDQKIMLLKYLKEVVFDVKTNNSNKEKDKEEDDVVSSDRRNELLSFVEQQIEEKRKEKKSE
jgi:hypothetical protein